jgi:hypothetical protein
MRSITAFISVFLLPWSAAAEMVPGSQFSYGNWSGAGYTYDTGSFSHCAISTSYLSGNVLTFTVNGDATVNVAVSSPTDTFTVSEVFPVALYVDRRAPFYGNATALDARFAVMRVPDFDRALESFRRGRTLVVQSKYGDVPFDLTGTSRALAATFECAVRHQYYHAPSLPAASNQVDPALLMQVATGNITTLGVSDFSFLSSSEVRELFPGADPTVQSIFWRSRSLGLISGVLVSNRGDAIDLKSGDASDLAFLSGICDGDFVTGTREVPNSDLEMREVRAACKSGQATSEHFMTKFFLDDKVVYSWLWFEGAENQGNSMPPRKQMSESAALQTASYLSD